VLIIEDLPTDAELNEREVRTVLPSAEFLRVETKEAFLDALDAFRPDLILSDFKLPRFDGLTALKLAQELVPETPFLVITGSINEDTAVACMKAGAWDYVIKEHLRRLGPAVLNALGQKRLRQERRRAEDAARENVELYRKLFEHHAAIKLMIDPESGKIIDANGAAVEFYGWRRDELRRMTIQEINTLPPDEVRKAIKTVRSRKRFHFEFRHRRADGSVRDVEVFSSRIELKGKDILHSIIHDITDRKEAEKEHRRLEAALQQARKMEAVGQLAGGIAHDFSNILNAVVGYAGLLQMQMDRADPLRHYADEIVEAGMRGAALTLQILAFSRKQVLDVRPANMNDIVAGIELMLRRLVREDIGLELDLSGGALTVLADENQVGQVLINLVANARDAIARGGTIRIKTESFVMDPAYVALHGFGREGAYVLLSVADNGRGMDAATRSRIFEPFFTTKEVGKGTGLGLAVVHGIVKQHNGFVNVYSEPGHGTVFKIYLPLTDRLPEQERSRRHERAAGGTETLLLAEDDASLRKMSVALLRHHGYAVLEAADGAEALRVFSEHRDRIRLVLLDGIMPHRNGKEVFDEIRGERPGMRAIIMSGYAEEMFADGGVPAGAVFLQKPVRPDALLRAVREALDRAAPHGP
jgi:PAS domain S-box-containing protein